MKFFFVLVIVVIGFVSCTPKENSHIQNSQSMEPTIAAGDLVTWVESRNATTIERGDLVIMNSPISKGQLWVRRVIGLSGEEIEFQNGNFEIDGKKVQLISLDESSELFLEKQKIPKNSVFVLGDNHKVARDSRHIGCVQIGDIVGKVTKY